MSMSRKLTNLPPAQALADLQIIAASASSWKPLLSSRISEICTWANSYSAGRLASAKYILSFLTQLVFDAQSYLELEEARLYSLEFNDPDFYNEMRTPFTPAELYWLEAVFPAWLSEADPKQSLWRGKLLRGEFQADDASTIDNLASAIEKKGGSAVFRLLSDLSMSTDLVVVSPKGKPLCIQLTRQGGNHFLNKSNEWETELKDRWKIDRGLFLSFIPPPIKPFNSHPWQALAQIIIHVCDQIQPGQYIVKDIGRV
jgi:hypothetical protein